ncbi:DUF1329 domain-containing protein [Piscinibacter defluvii]|uniref:DUF1329 domain-containing protein n=1 Tax=Piscinibacter defluvii TaxID=1796922 RepID=UPI00197BCD8C|nr:DUF1329 domain-containing protein [Piscinibacter defluvii]
MNRWTRGAAAVALLAGGALASTAALGATEAQAQALGKDLTPMGAERGANKDGSIPAWNGGDLKAPAGWKPGQARPDPYAADKPLYSIDAGNADKYKDRLSDGQLALLKQLKGYRMDVYPTRRSCGYPQPVYDNTRKNATSAKLAANGIDIGGGVTGGVPFPIPENGTQAMWNYKMRWVGEGRSERYSTVFSSPGDGKFVPLVQDQLTATPLGNLAGKPVNEGDGLEWLVLNEVVTPAARTGEIILIHYYQAKDNDAWLYFPGQRRVRRAPTFAYDNPVPGYENLLAVDQYPMFGGRLDRYDWKLAGKQELIVPYNTFRFNNQDAKLVDIFGADYPKRELIRYEAHRVWKIEATVKEGQRHQFPKRTIYLDEDTWAMVAADNYDAQGKVWRVQESYPYVAWELPACVYQGYIVYDLNVGRYMADNMPQEGKVD